MFFCSRSVDQGYEIPLRLGNHAITSRLSEMVTVKVNNDILDICHLCKKKTQNIIIAKSTHSWRIAKLLFCFHSIPGTIKFHFQQRTWKQLLCSIMREFDLNIHFHSQEMKEKWQTQLFQLLLFGSHMCWFYKARNIEFFSRKYP